MWISNIPYTHVHTYVEQCPRRDGDAVRVYVRILHLHVYPLSHATQRHRVYHSHTKYAEHAHTQCAHRHPLSLYILLPIDHLDRIGCPLPLSSASGVYIASMIRHRRRRTRYTHDPAYNAPAIWRGVRIKSQYVRSHLVAERECTHSRIFCIYENACVSSAAKPPPPVQ